MIIKLLVEGGDMKPGPAIAQKIGPLGINMGKIIQEVNEQTKSFKGMKVPVILDVDTKTKSFTISSNRHLWVQKQTSTLGFGRKGLSGATAFVSWTPYHLVRVDRLRGGEEQLSDEIGCTIPFTDISWKNRIISAPNVQTAKSRSLNPGEKFNYISGTITRMREGNAQDGGYCIYSNGKGRIYPIERWETGSGVYNVVNVNAGAIKSVTCCDGDNLPDKTCKNGKWWNKSLHL